MAKLDIQVLASGAVLLVPGVAFATASVGVPEELRAAGLRRWLLAEAGAHAGVEVVGLGALVGLAEAAASQRVEVLAAGAFLVFADAVAEAFSGHEFVASGAGKRGAHTSARGLVPDAVAAALLNNAFKIAGSNVPGVPFRLIVNLGLADALAASLVPDHGVSLGVGALAIISALALALAVVEVPEVVIGARPSHTQAFSGKCVELFPRVVAVLHFISAGAVSVLVGVRAPYELTEGASDQLVGLTIATGKENSIDDCNSVFYFSLSKISSNLMLGGFKG